MMKENNNFVLSNENLAYMKILAARVGIDLSEYQEYAIYNRLIRRLRGLQLSDFDSYCRLLRNDIAEEEKFINLITNQTTYFFRENHHFQYLEQHLPLLMAKKKKIRIWSAGCSTGEEPYSMAIIIRELIKPSSDYDIKILATDVNTDALLTAKRGIYEGTGLKKMSLLRQKIGFHPLDDTDAKVFQVNDNIKTLISFKQLNLMTQWPMRGPFDIIFCRNVIIYFKKDIRERILEHFNKLLAVGGVLILGYSENLQGIKSQYTLIGNTIYKKNS